MARRYYRRKYSRQGNLVDSLLDILKPVLGLVLLGFLGWGFTHQKEFKLYGVIFCAVVVVGVILFFIFRNRKTQNLNLNILSDEKILYMLKGMSPVKFEFEMADMFERLGYKTEITGGANDGGIDIIATKDGKKYFIQCKKFITREVNPHDVRDFLGAITNINNSAERGYFITTNKFTLMAEKAAEGNPRIELIDGNKLIEYYKQSNKTA